MCGMLRLQVFMYAMPVDTPSFSLRFIGVDANFGFHDAAFQQRGVVSEWVSVCVCVCVCVCV